MSGWEQPHSDWSMSDLPTLDDTQPHGPFDDRPIESAREIRPDDEAAVGGGPGCGVMALVGGLLALFSLGIVVLAAAAGWTSGQREANALATATQNAAINEQLGRIPVDIESGNLVLLDTRIRFLATMTPGVPGIEGFAQTATALAIAREPTTTPTPQPTIEATPTLELTPEIIITPSGNGFDLAALVQQAQAAVNAGQYQDAIDLLEVVNGIDPMFDAANVRRLLTEAMNAHARSLYQLGQPAAANLIVGRMEALGIPLGDGIAYEREVAIVYLNARAAIGINPQQAIRALQQLISFGPGRYYDEARQLLYNQYIAYGDALAYDPNFGFCPAIAQYQAAVNLFASGPANAKLSMANTMCAQATPTFDPLFEQPGDQPLPEGFAPLGVVEPPGT